MRSGMSSGRRRIALLHLSEIVCERAALSRYTFGNPSAESEMPNEIAATIREYAQHVTFTDADLRRLGVTPESLAPFIFDPAVRLLVPAAGSTHSPLHQHPLLRLTVSGCSLCRQLSALRSEHFSCEA